MKEALTNLKMVYETKIQLLDVDLKTSNTVKPDVFLSLNSELLIFQQKIYQTFVSELEKILNS